MGQTVDQSLCDEASRRSAELLKQCSTDHGFLASTERIRNYHSVWGRDGCICATAAFLTDDEDLVRTAHRTLRTLAENQAPNGQVPSYLPICKDGSIEAPVYGGLGEITTIDANLWFMIACQTAMDMGVQDEFLSKDCMDVYRKVIEFLYCLDCNSCGLLEIPTAGDWTDILTRSYHVLYDEVLWYRSLKCAASLAEDAGHKTEDERFESSALRVKKRLNEDFWWGDRKTIERVCDKYMIKTEIDRDKTYPYYQSHLEPFFNSWSHRFDAFANVLASLMGIASRQQAESIVGDIYDRELHKPFPLRVLDPPIEEDDADSYQLRFSQEAAWDYHNGGIWPLAGGFWVMLLKVMGRDDEALESLEDLAKANQASREDDDFEWGFYEYHHGRSHQPSGTPRLAWNAAAYLIAHQGLLHDRIACFERGADF